jgi:mxaJ protein
MSSRSRDAAAAVLTLALALSVACSSPSSGAPRSCRASDVLRVCADPNNMPFSNERGEGFENRIAEMVGRELGVPVAYTWWAQRRGFVRNTLKACDCDLVVGVPAGFEMALTTRPYYRSSYVFVSRADRHLAIHSLDDPRLRTLRIGVEMIGDDFSNSPPAHALTRRRIVENVRGYTVYGDYTKANPPSRIVDAVASGEIDVAVAWGPMAAYFAAREPVALDVEPVEPKVDVPFLPLTFEIAMGVRREDGAFKDQLDEILKRLQPEIDRLLDEYRVPRVEAEGGPR